MLANSVYGKFAQNPNNRTYAKLCICERYFNKSINSNRFLRASIILQTVTIIEYKPEKILYDSLYPVVATILDAAMLNSYYYYFSS